MVLTDVVDRSNEESAGQVSQDSIEAVVVGTAARWKDAPVQDYIPLLAERAARSRLKKIMAAASNALASLKTVS